jgi:hypothetical protein
MSLDDSAAYAYLFDEDSEAIRQTLGHGPLAAMLGVALAEFRSTAFRIRQGSLLLHFRSLRADEVTLAPSAFVEGISAAETLANDARLHRLLLWELCDSIAERWTTTSEEDLPMLLGPQNVWIISLWPLSHLMAERFDAGLAGDAGYLGAVEIDPGNPLQRDLLWESLIYSLYYECGRLVHVQGWDVPEERYDLQGRREWWDALPFDDVCWHEDCGSPEREPLPLPAVPLSERGRLTAARLRTREAPSHLQRVVSELARGSEPHPTPVTLSATLPGGEDPVIDPQKLTRYVLNPDHERGGHKARLFRDLLGMTASDWRFLDAQIRQGVLRAPVHRVRSERWGVKYHVDIAVIGKNGAIKAVRTAWIVETGASPHLTSAYIAPQEVEIQKLPPPQLPPLLEPPPASDAEWKKLFELADSHGREAAASTVPTPMFVGGRGYPDGECGGASVTLKDARRGFARWLLKNGHGHRGSKGGAEITSFGEFGQSAERAGAYADAFAAVLKLNGVGCSVHHFLD